MSKQEEITLRLNDWIYGMDHFGNFHLGRIKRVYVETDSYANKFTVLPKCDWFTTKQECIDAMYDEIKFREMLNNGKHPSFMPKANKKQLAKSLDNFIKHREKLESEKSDGFM